jgi:hypothetical protein
LGTFALYVNNVIVEVEKELSHGYAAGDFSTLLATLEKVQARPGRARHVTGRATYWRSGGAARRYRRH